MANLNKVMLIGRLTRDPEVRAFSNGGKVAKFGFAVNNRKKNQQTGQWEDEPVFLDVEAFNRGEFGKQADLVEQYLTKGRQVYVEGHLRMDSWEKDGQKRTKLVIVVDNLQFLDSGRQDGASGMGDGDEMPAARPSRPAPGPARSSGSGYGAAKPASKPLYQAEPDEPAESPSDRGGGDDDIPF